MTSAIIDEALNRLAAAYIDLLTMAVSYAGAEKEQARSFLEIDSGVASDCTEGTPRLHAAHDACQAAGQLEGQAMALELLGNVAEEQENPTPATRRYRESLFTYLAVGSTIVSTVRDRLKHLSSPQ
ncbi:hypothetical protein [Streptomyces sp. NPDC057199]|uniref:hypothetical protein n=1 Tax=Streptomyces sp. NPDC057199 TaxID=3346047 RepID=UPI00363C655A